MGLTDILRGSRSRTRSGKGPFRMVSTERSSSSTERGQLVGRIAAYESVKTPPEITEVRESSAAMFIEAMTARAHAVAREAGGNISYTLIREIVENLVHADFCDPIVTIDHGGNRVRVSDHGPGIKDHSLACERGFTTAAGPALDHIKGVGNGLAYCKEVLLGVGGGIELNSNLGTGTVVTLWVPRVSGELIVKDDMGEFPDVEISDRQKKVLFLVMEIGEAGPSQVASELKISLSSAYRDLRQLEESGLIRSDGEGKRGLAALGVKYLEIISRPE